MLAACRILTSAESPLLSAVLGAVIALVSGGVLRGRDARRAAEDARGRAVEEALATADDLLEGVRLFRTVRGGRSRFRALATGMERGGEKLTPKEDGSLPSFREALGVGFLEVVAAASAGGLFDEVMDKDSAHYQGMVVPPRQRLTAAVRR
jgi:hypothetical protein